jgi:hypothetical protein
VVKIFTGVDAMFWLVLAAGCPYVWAIGAFRKPHLKLVPIDGTERELNVAGLNVLLAFVLVETALIAFLTVFSHRRPEMIQTVEALVLLSSSGLLVSSIVGYWIDRSVLAEGGIFYGILSLIFYTVYWAGSS